jgi:hypothetical protein
MQRMCLRLIACVLGFAAGAQAAEERVVVRPADTGAALANPGMGWVFHYYDNVPAHYGSKLAPSDTLDDWPGLTVIYLRIPWSYIEPEEEKFNWSVLDTPAQRWIAKGKQVAFRITTSESWTRWAGVSQGRRVRRTVLGTRLRRSDLPGETRPFPGGHGRPLRGQAGSRLCRRRLAGRLG